MDIDPVNRPFKLARAGSPALGHDMDLVPLLGERHRKISHE